MRSLSIALLLVGCGGGATRHYQPGLLDLSARVSAKQVCSCTFVMKRDAEFCGEWTRVSPDIARFSIDLEDGVVTTHALLFGTARAHFVDPQTGCVLE